VYLLLLQSAVLFVLNTELNFRLGKLNYPENNWEHAFLGGSASVIIAPLFLVIWHIFKNNQPLWKPALAAMITGVAFFITISEWDKRQPVSFPSPLSNSEEFAGFRRIIPENSLVYWEDNNALNVWLLLERSSYISETQTAGIVFNRQTALEALRRAENIRPLSMRDNARTMDWKWQEKLLVQPKVNKNDLTKVCRDPLLSYVVFASPIDGAIEVASHKDTQTGQRYHLYDCSIMRQG
jgi:hypothetical protein